MTIDQRKMDLPAIPEIPVSGYLAQLTHDLNQPLTTLTANIEAAIALAPTPAQQKCLERALHQGERVIELAKWIRALVEADGTEPHSILSLSALVDEVASDLQLLAQERRVTLSADIQPGLSVRGNRDSLYRAYWYLMEELLALTAESGTITLILHDAAGSYSETIILGSSINTQMAADLFASRPHTSSRISFAPPVAKRLLEFIGGHLDVTHVQGQGAGLCVKLPLQQQT